MSHGGICGVSPCQTVQSTQTTPNKASNGIYEDANNDKALATLSKVSEQADRAAAQAVLELKLNLKTATSTEQIQEMVSAARQKAVAAYSKLPGGVDLSVLQEIAKVEQAALAPRPWGTFRAQQGFYGE